MYKFAVNICPHHGFKSLSIDDELGGRRLTPRKCCGTWKRIHSWPLTLDLAKEMIEELQKIVNLLESSENENTKKE